MNEGGETMGDKVQTWRVVLTDGGVHEVPVECIGEDSYLARFRHIAAWGGTPRRAVLGLASSCFGDAVEIVSPDGNITSDVHALRNERGVLLREVLRLRAENATLRASTDAAVDGVRAMLPEALKVAREEGAAAMRALMAGRTTRPTREEFDALAEIGATLRVQWPGGDDEIPTHGDYYWTAIATVPEGSRWWAHGADGALIEWPKVTP